MAREFDLIARHFAPLAGPEGLGLKDDAACWLPPPAHDLVVTKDLIVEGTHFLPTDPPETLGHKALAVNLSDLAAKGAEPGAYFVGLALPEGVDDAWLAAFAAGLRALQSRAGCRLAGGDMTRTKGPMVISVTATGVVPAGSMIRRAGAQVGDDIWVSGTIGDGALGLAMLLGKLAPQDGPVARYRCPTPRTRLGRSLRGVARAGADVSDGLLADLGHICSASDVAAVISWPEVPRSEAVAAALRAGFLSAADVCSGGDDYELVFTAPTVARAEVLAAAHNSDTPVSRVGEVVAAERGTRVTLLDEDGNLLPLSRLGYSHFIAS